MSSTHPFSKPLISLGLLCALLAGCGGGGSSGSSTASAGSGSEASTPGAPTLKSLSVGSGSISVSFTAPTSDGGATITGYTVTCTAAGNTDFTASGTKSPITVSGMNGGVTRSCTVAATNSAGTGSSSAAKTGTPTSLAPEDITHLTVGDNSTSTTTPAVGVLYECSVLTGGGGATTKGPWFNSDGKTWDETKKVAVQGSVSWPSHSFTAGTSGNFFDITGNDLPDHDTGTYPIASTDPAHAYDTNPNSIMAQSIAWMLPGSPTYSAQPSCVGGLVGILVTGSELFSAVDGENRDAGAWEIQDSCQGHPDGANVYHYHTISSCEPADTPGEHSPLVGYAADGFPIYGNLGEDGVPLSNADLDECHGHTHAITINGVTVVEYHYHATHTFPYDVGCYRGTPAAIH